MIKPLGKVRRFPNGIFWTRQARLKECFPFYGRIIVTFITTIESQLLQQEPDFIYQLFSKSNPSPGPNKSSVYTDCINILEAGISNRELEVHLNCP